MIKLNLVGVYASVFALTICILIFVSRLVGIRKADYWLGIAFLTTAIPYIYILLSADNFNRPKIYYIQIITILLFLLIELLLDYIFKIDFRSIRWMTITYVTFFFAAAGGMVGLASNGGKLWTIISVILFFIMTALAFIQRSVTGI